MYKFTTYVDCTSGDYTVNDTVPSKLYMHM